MFVWQGPIQTAGTSPKIAENRGGVVVGVVARPELWSSSGDRGRHAAVIGLCRLAAVESAGPPSSAPALRSSPRPASHSAVAASLAACDARGGDPISAPQDPAAPMPAALLATSSSNDSRPREAAETSMSSITPIRRRASWGASWGGRFRAGSSARCRGRGRDRSRGCSRISSRARCRGGIHGRRRRCGHGGDRG